MPSFGNDLNGNSENSGYPANWIGVDAYMCICTAVLDDRRLGMNQNSQNMLITRGNLSFFCTFPRLITQFAPFLMKQNPTDLWRRSKKSVGISWA